MHFSSRACHPYNIIISHLFVLTAPTHGSAHFACRSPLWCSSKNPDISARGAIKFNISLNLVIVLLSRANVNKNCIYFISLLQNGSTFQTQRSSCALYITLCAHSANISTQPKGDGKRKGSARKIKDIYQTLTNSQDATRVGGNFIIALCFEREDAEMISLRVQCHSPKL